MKLHIEKGEGNGCTNCNNMTNLKTHDKCIRSIGIGMTGYMSVSIGIGLYLIV